MLFFAGLASTWEDDSWQLPLLSFLHFLFHEATASLSVAKDRMQGKRTRRGMGCGHETVPHTLDSCPLGDKQRQCTSRRKSEKGNGGQLIWMVGEAVKQILNFTYSSII